MRIKLDADLSGAAVVASGLTVFGAALAAINVSQGMPLEEAARIVGLCVLAIPAFGVLQFVEVTLHELGHYLAARAVGFRVTEFHVLSLRMRFSEEARSSRWALGSVGVETTAAQDRPLPWTVVLLAGPAFSLLIVVAALIGRRTLGEPWSLILSALGVLGAFSAYRTLWPTHGRGANDMGLVLDAFRPDSDNFLARAYARLDRTADDPFGVEADPRDLDRCLRSPHPAWHVRARQVACYQAIARQAPGARDAARAYAESIDAASGAEMHKRTRRWVESLREDAILEHAFAAALFDGDPAPGRGVADRLTVLEEASWTTARRADAALAFAEGDPAEARRRAAAARAILDRDRSDAPHWTTEDRFLAILEDRIRSSASA